MTGIDPGVLVDRREGHTPVEVEQRQVNDDTRRYLKPEKWYDEALSVLCEDYGFGLIYVDAAGVVGKMNHHAQSILGQRFFTRGRRELLLRQVVPLDVAEMHDLGREDNVVAGWVNGTEVVRRLADAKLIEIENKTHGDKEKIRVSLIRPMLPGYVACAILMRDATVIAPGADVAASTVITGYLEAINDKILDGLHRKTKETVLYLTFVVLIVGMLSFAVFYPVMNAATAVLAYYFLPDQQPRPRPPTPNYQTFDTESHPGRITIDPSELNRQPQE